MKATPSLITICCGLTGVVAGAVCALPRNGSVNDVRLEPQFVEVIGNVPEYQPRTVHLQLRNESRDEIVVRSVTTTCGCTNVVTRGGTRLVDPITIPPGGMCPFEATIDTARRPGAQVYSVVIESQRRDRTIKNEARIAMNVLPSWRAHPYSLVFKDVRGDTSPEEIQILDAFPGEGIQLDRVVTSKPECVEIEVTRVDAAANIQDSQGYVDGVRCRYRLQVSLRFRDGPVHSFEEVLRLISKDSTVPPLLIPIVCRTAEPEYRLVPASLTIVPSSKTRTVERVVRCFLSGKAQPTLRVLNAPDFCDVVIKPAGPKEVLIQIQFRVPSVPIEDTSAKVVFCAGVDSSRVIALPIHFLRAAN